MELEKDIFKYNVNHNAGQIDIYNRHFDNTGVESDNIVSVASIKNGKLQDIDFRKLDISQLKELIKKIEYYNSLDQEEIIRKRYLHLLKNNPDLVANLFFEGNWQKDKVKYTEHYLKTKEYTNSNFDQIFLHYEKNKDEINENLRDIKNAHDRMSWKVGVKKSM